MAHESLVSALQDQHQWEARAAHAKELQTLMLASRREAAELARQHDIRPVPQPKPGEVCTMGGPLVSQALPCPACASIVMSSGHSSRLVLPSTMGNGTACQSTPGVLPSCCHRSSLLPLCDIALSRASAVLV